MNFQPFYIYMYFDFFVSQLESSFSGSVVSIYNSCLKIGMLEGRNSADTSSCVIMMATLVYPRGYSLQANLAIGENEGHHLLSSQ